MSGVETIWPGASLAAGGAQWSDSTGTALVRPDGTSVLVGAVASIFPVAPSASVDCLAALQAALDALALARADGSIGGTLLLPPGVFVISNTLKIPTKVVLRGAGREGTILRAMPSFPVSTPLVWLGRDGVDASAFDCRVESMRIHCALIAGSIGIKTKTAQEMSGARDVLVSNYMGTGIIIDGGSGGGAEHTAWRDMEVYSDDTSLNTRGIFIQSSAQTQLDRVTVYNGGGVKSTSQAIYVNDAKITASDINCEWYNNGIYFNVGAGGSVNGCGGNHLTYMVHYTDPGVPLALSAIGSGWDTDISGGFVSDDVSGFLAKYPVAQHALGRNGANGSTNNLIQSPVFTASLTPDLYNGDVVAMAALTGNTTINAPSHIRPGQVVNFLFVQDAVGGRTVSWNAAYKFPVAWTNTGNTANTRSAITFLYDGTYLWAVGANLWA